MNYQGIKTTKQARADGSPVIMNVSGKTVNYTRRLRVTCSELPSWPGGIYNPQFAKQYTEDFFTNYRTMQRVMNELNGNNVLITNTSTVRIDRWYELLLCIIQRGETIKIKL